MKKRLNRYSAGASSVLPNGLYLLLCAAIVATLFWDASTTALVTWSPQAFFWGHVAALQELMQNAAMPGSAEGADVAASAYFLPLFWLLAVVGRSLGFDAMQLMTAAAVIDFLLLAIGLRLFLAYYFRHPWAPFIGVLVLFFCWGIAGSGPGLYQLSNFLQIAGDPSTFAFALSLIAFWATMRLLRSEISLPLWAVLLAALTAFAFVSHPLTGLFCAIGCMLLVITEFSSSRVAPLVAVVAVLAGLALAELWPWFSIWKLVLGLYLAAGQSWSPEALLAAPLEQATAAQWAAILYDPSALLAVLGVALLGIPILFRLIQRGEQPFIVYGVLLFLLPYALNLLIDVPLAYHFLLFAVFYLQLALVWGWLRLISAWSEVPRPPLAAPLLLTSIVAGAALVLLNVWLTGQEKQGKVFSALTFAPVESRTAIPGGVNVPEFYRTLLAPVDDKAVILARPETGWPVAAIKGAIVTPLNRNPLVTDMQDRILATEVFFNKSPTDLQRVATVQRFGISHVLIDTAAELPPELVQWLNNYSRPVAENGPYRVYELASALQQVKLPRPAPQKAAAKTAQGQPEAAVTQPQKPAADVRPAATANPAAAGEAPQPDNDKEEQAPLRFGAPIAAPVLDPERNGG